MVVDKVSNLVMNSSILRITLLPFQVSLSFQSGSVNLGRFSEPFIRFQIYYKKFEEITCSQTIYLPPAEWPKLAKFGTTVRTVPPFKFKKQTEPI